MMFLAQVGTVEQVLALAEAAAIRQRTDGS
jgi:hypothetical protein